MLSFPGSLKIFIALEPVDLRAGINMLHAPVADRLKEDGRGGALFVFCQRAAEACRGVHDPEETGLYGPPWRGVRSGAAGAV